jgi:hypothetical protein
VYALPSLEESFFPGAAVYREQFGSDAVCEASGRYFPYTERHLQALWFDDHLRPIHLKTSRGEPVTVENPGRWNLEAGPDFLGAVLLIGREKRRVAGDAEVHIFSNDWKNHGHADDPRYANVRFHITWFSGNIDESLFPPGTVHISYYDICTTDLDSIDTTAYPYAEPRASKNFPMSGKNPDEIFQTLENAGQQRLRQKTQRMAWLIRQRGAAQALYEETAAALGYKHNKAPFRRLAQKVPLEALAPYGRDWKTVYAVLLGLSGLLPRQPGARWPDASRKELRSLWDIWWREEHKWEEVLPLDKKEWRLAGVRPLNHPVRRLCALAQWAAFGFFVEGAARSERLAPPSGPESSGRATPPAEPGFQTLENCFWTEHVGWSGKEKPAELVGKGRLDAIELNIFIPFRLAQGDASAMKHLPAEPMNSVIRETAYALFGPDHSPKLYRTALARQGLIQIFNDCILTGRLDELAGALSDKEENV